MLLVFGIVDDCGCRLGKLIFVIGGMVFEGLLDCGFMILEGLVFWDWDVGVLFEFFLGDRNGE